MFNYTTPYLKKRTCLSFGSYPEVSIANARIQRKEARELLAENIDPKEDRDEKTRQKETAQSNTLKHIAASWLDVKRTTVSSNHADDTWRSLELHIFPTLANVPIHKINAVRTIEVIKPIASKGSLETVKRICQRLNEIMVFSVNSGLIENNPLAGIAKAFQTPKKQHLPTLHPNELPELLSNIAIASVKRTTRCLIEWQLHTMVRPGEAAGTRWKEINLDKNLWTIPDERMKKGKEHIIPLSNQALNILNIMKSFSSKSEFVFPSDRCNKKHTNSSTANVALKRMGYGNKLVAHGLRSLASTILNEEGFDPDIIESALAHVGQNEVRNAYNRANYLERRKPLMQWWSDYLESAATGSFSMAGKRGLQLAR